MINFYDSFNDSIFHTGKIINSKNEEKFQNEIYKKTGVDIKRSFYSVFLDKNNETYIINLRILVIDNDISNTLSTYTQSVNNHHFNIIVEFIWKCFDEFFIDDCLNEEQKELYFKSPSKKFLFKLSMGIEMPRASYRNSLAKVNTALRRKFPLIKKCAYVWGDSFYIIYKSEDDLKKDTENGKEEIMRRTAFAAFKKYDFFDYVDYGKFSVMFVSVESLKSDDVFGITRENFGVPWIGYTGKMYD